MKAIFKSFIFLLLFESLALLADNPHTANHFIVWGLFLFYIFAGSGLLQRETEKERRQNDRLLNLSTILIILLLTAFIVFYFYLPENRFAHLRFSFLIMSLILYALTAFGINEANFKKRTGTDLRYTWINSWITLLVIVIISKIIHLSSYIVTATIVSFIVGLIYSSTKKSNKAIIFGHVTFFLSTLAFFFIWVQQYVLQKDWTFFFGKIEIWQMVVGILILFIPLNYQIMQLQKKVKELQT